VTKTFRLSRNAKYRRQLFPGKTLTVRGDDLSAGHWRAPVRLSRSTAPQGAKNHLKRQKFELKLHGFGSFEARPCI
jgi:hypothetical protein